MDNKRVSFLIIIITGGSGWSYMTLHAEISIIPISKSHDTTSMSKGVAAAFDAISKIKGLKVTLTALGTQIEASDLADILHAVEAAHEAAKSVGALRIISTIKIDERLDKNQSLEDKIISVKQKLSD